LVCAEYGYPKGSPNTNSYRRNPPLQLSIQCSPQRTSKWPSSKPHGATRQQAIAKTPAEWSGYQIPSVIEQHSRRQILSIFMESVSATLTCARNWSTGKHNYTALALNTAVPNGPESSQLFWLFTLIYWQRNIWKIFNLGPGGPSFAFVLLEAITLFWNLHNIAVITALKIIVTAVCNCVTRNFSFGVLLYLLSSFLPLLWGCGPFHKVRL
jgi:hypothetical protein